MRVAGVRLPLSEGHELVAVAGVPYRVVVSLVPDRFEPEVVDPDARRLVRVVGRVVVEDIVEDEVVAALADRQAVAAGAVDGVVRDYVVVRPTGGVRALVKPDAVGARVDDQVVLDGPLPRVPGSRPRTRRRWTRRPCRR